MSEKPELSDHLRDYRKWLVAAEQKSQEDFDKTVLSLSGGALGISFVFLKDVIGENPILHPTFLFMAWMAWALSTFVVLTSYYLSHLALREAISQVDAGTIYNQRAGRSFASWTAWLNALGAVLFLVGVCCITAFANFNLSAKGVQNVRKESAVSNAASTVTTTSAASAVTTTTTTTAAAPISKRRSANN